MHRCSLWMSAHWWWEMWASWPYQIFPRDSVLYSWGVFITWLRAVVPKMVFLVLWPFYVKCSWVKDEMKNNWENVVGMCTLVKNCSLSFLGDCSLFWSDVCSVQFYLALLDFFSFLKCYGVEMSNTYSYPVLVSFSVVGGWHSLPPFLSMGRGEGCD